MQASAVHWQVMLPHQVQVEVVIWLQALRKVLQFPQQLRVSTPKSPDMVIGLCFGQYNFAAVISI